MKCNQEGHTISECDLRWCKPCGKLVDKDEHTCIVEPRGRHVNHREEHTSPPRHNEMDQNQQYASRSPDNTPDRIFHGASSATNTERELQNDDHIKVSSKTSVPTSNSGPTTPKNPQANSNITAVTKSNITSKKNDEYIGQQVILTKNNKDRSKPSITSPNEAKKHEWLPSSRQSSMSAWTVNSINFSGSSVDRSNMRILSPKVSPINNLDEYPPIPTLNTTQNSPFFSTPKNNLSKESNKGISKTVDETKANLSDQSKKEEASALPESSSPQEDSNQLVDLSDKLFDEEVVQDIDKVSNINPHKDKLLGEEVVQNIDKVSNINPHKADYFDGHSYFDSPNFFDNTNTSYH